MKPVDFKGSNVTFQKPAGWTDEQCGNLPTFQHFSEELKTKVIISCWELTPEEKEEIMKEGKLYLSICGFQPPVLLQVTKPSALVEALTELEDDEKEK